MHYIHWCGGGLELEDITANNIGEHDLTPIMRYIMVRLDNLDRTIFKRGDIINDSLWNKSYV